MSTFFCARRNLAKVGFLSVEALPKVGLNAGKGAWDCVSSFLLRVISEAKFSRQKLLLSRPEI